MIEEIKHAVSSGHGTAVLYTAGLALVFADAIPTPADAVYFHLETKLRDDWDAGRLSAEQYWTKKTLNYFLPDVLWWSGVVLALAYTGKTFDQKLKVGMALVGAGAVAGVIVKQYLHDRETIRQKGAVKRQ